MTRRAGTAQDDALRQLRADLVRGRLKPGDQIVQEALAERYGISRVPIREALRVLEAEGHVVYHPNRGHFVAELSVEDLLEVYRLRELLEAEAIRVGVPRLGKADFAALSKLADEVSAAAAKDDVIAMTAANRMFHFAIFDAAGMPRLTRTLGQLWDATDTYRAIYFGDEINRSRVLREHERIVAAARRHDAERVIALHDDHRGNSVATVRSVLEASTHHEPDAPTNRRTS